MQVSEAIFKYGRELGVQVLPVYGGQPIGRQLQALDRGVDVVVATPGRALDHIAAAADARRGPMVVLDEADEMLDMGFADDIEAILERFADEPPDGALLGDHAAADRPDRPPPPARPRAHRDGPRGAEAGEAPLVRQSEQYVETQATT